MAGGSGPLAGPAFERTNYRGARLVTGAGVVVPFAMVGRGRRSVETVVPSHGVEPRRDVHCCRSSLLCGVGFGFLGLFDDIAGVGQSGGFRGHVRALRRGPAHLGHGQAGRRRGARAVVVASSLGRGDDGVVGLLRDGAIVALAANLANLFDRAPGRVIKVTTPRVRRGRRSWPAHRRWPARPWASAPGSASCVPTSRERAMLGDAGANPLGALCGLGCRSSRRRPPARRWIVLSSLLAR